MKVTDQILRVFEVRAMPGCAEQLLDKLSRTSITVVKGQPGNQGHYFGSLESADGNELVFISIWSSLDAVKARFGDEWQSSFLPEGYEAIIESCSVRHFRVSGEVEGG